MTTTAVPKSRRALKTKRELANSRWQALKSERSSWDSHCKDIAENFLPRSGRFFVEDRNRGEKRHNKIYDNCGPRALKVMSSGMMAGATSPARPWFRLAAADPDLNEFQPVKLWLDDVRKRMLRVFSRSNTYQALPQIYEELGAFGTAATIVMPNFDRVIHLHTQTFGEYAISTDFEERVNTFYREFQKTVAATVKEFGYENCSRSLQNAWDEGNLDAWVTIVHMIEPREDRNLADRTNKNMPFRSCYFELNADKGHNEYLSESGFDKFPVLAPRWDVKGGDIYGNSPGMEALGDAKQLQHEQLRKGQGIDYKTKPPLQAPSTMKDRDVDMLPGGVTFVDVANPAGKITSLFDVNLDLNHLLEDIRDVRERIRASFFADLFLMLYQGQDDPKKTATEVAELHEEKLLMLGPALERLHTELLEPLVDTTFERMFQVGALPPPPEEMRGMPLNIEFVSMLAQAQRAVSTNAIDRFTGSVGAFGQLKPDVLDKIDGDAFVDIYADALGVDPKMVLPSDQVQALRQARAKAQAAKEQSAVIAQQAGAAKDLAAAPTGGQTALSDVMDMFSQGLSPSPGGTPAGMQ